MYLSRLTRALDRLLPVGPRSVLWGAHAWFLHPAFVLAAWTRLYGFPLDPRVHLAIFVHDLGYLTRWCTSMDGPDGEQHVIFGERVMAVFGPEWAALCRHHSRFIARQDGAPPSRLCAADKLSAALEPAWLYLPRVVLSGEVREYLRLASGGPESKYHGEPQVGDHAPVTEALTLTNLLTWHRRFTAFVRAWVEVHKDGAEDTWTPPARTGEGA